MQCMVLFDSMYGNTEKIARAVAEGCIGNTQVISVNEVKLDAVSAVDMLIMGSPVHGGQATPALQEFIQALPSLKGKSIACFDTRMDIAKQNFFLKTLMGVIGYAAPKMLAALVAKGAKELTPPEGFIVEGKEGPLAEGELERAKRWGQRCILCYS